MEFIEAPAFTRHVSDYLAEDEYRQLQNELAGNPEFGDLMPGTGGFRKLRWADSSRGKGRRGGLRIIYYYFLADQQIWLMTLYGKDEAADLTPKEKKTLRSAMEAELRTREAKRLAPEKRRRAR
jgi:mRNA-degrading endonuclease RelE of RelBE toxin-antitoxin system